MVSEIAICQHRDQALLCTIIGEANTIVSETGKGHVSRRAVISAFCYAKIAGVPTERHFGIFPGGPIANELVFDLEALEMDESIKNISLNPEGHADYQTGVGALSLCAKHRDWLELQRPKVRAVLKALTPLTNDHLAQVAAIHYLFLHLKRETAAAHVGAEVVVEFLAAVPGEGWTVNATAAIDMFNALAEAGVVHA